MTTRSSCGSHDSVMVPARNSSSIGCSSGSESSRPSGATAGISDCVVSLAITSSSSWSIRSVRAATCCFSSETLVSRAPLRAWRKKVRWPGSPTVPATKRSGGSNPWISGMATLGGGRRAGAAPDRLRPSLRGFRLPPRPFLAEGFSHDRSPAWVLLAST